MRSPEEKHEGLYEGLEVVVSIDGRLPLLVQGDVSEQLRKGNHSRSLLTSLSVHSIHPSPPTSHPIPEPSAGYYYRHRSHPPSHHHPDAIKTFLMHPESTMMRMPPLPPPAQFKALTHLHSDDGVDEEQHGYEEAHIRQRLRGDTSIVGREIKTAAETTGK